MQGSEVHRQLDSGLTQAIVLDDTTANLKEASTWIKRAKKKKQNLRRSRRVSTEEAKKKFIGLPFRKWYLRYYLNCRHWETFRTFIKRDRGGLCEECNSESNLVVHHVTYLTLFEERPEDVIQDLSS